MKSICQFIHEYARQSPDLISICGTGYPPLTYRQLADQMNDVVLAMRSMQIEANDRVAMLLPEGALSAVAVLSVMSGGICAPLNPESSLADLEPNLIALGAKALMLTSGADQQISAIVKKLGLKILEVNPIPGTAGLFTITGASASDKTITLPDLDQTALLLFTSGTAIRPKLVPLSHRNISAAATSISAVLELMPADRCHYAMPLFHIHGLSTLIATMITGGSFISMPGFEPDRFINSARDNHPTWYSASPTLHRVILDQIQERNIDITNYGLRFVRSASAPMPRLLIEEVERVFGVPLIEAYGMTEASPQIASNRLPPHARKTGSVGLPAGPEIAIIDESGNPLQQGKAGQVKIRGENIIRNYENDEASDTNAIKDGWLNTGDLGYLDSDGFLFITGRIKEIINRGGEKISPRKVEEILLEHWAVSDVVVFAMPHAVLIENIAAAVVLKHEFKQTKQEELIEQIKSFCAVKLASFEVPHQIAFVDKIPHGPTGKLKRNQLAEKLGLYDSKSTTTQIAPPFSQSEKRISAIFAEVLKISSPGLHDDFLALGGHSLVAMQVITRLQTIFQIKLPVNCLFEKPTVAQLSRYIGDLLADKMAGEITASNSSSIRSITDSKIQPQLSKSASSPLSFAQQRAYFTHQLGAHSAHNMSASLSLEGELDIPSLEKAIDEIRRRHEILRATFTQSGDRPVQVIGPFVPYELEVIDLSPLNRTDKELRENELATAEFAHSFDLEKGPLFRARLIKLEEHKHLLMITMHHIISDGWSVQVIYSELKEIYVAFHEGKTSPLSDLAIQYSDFSVWQQLMLQSGELDSQLEYWKKHLSGSPPLCTFPPDRKRPELQSFKGAIHRQLIDRSMSEKIKTLSQKNRVTPFMTCLAAFQSLLYRCTGQDDCIVGIPVANRSRSELEPLIGFFANTLVLRSDLSGNPTFEQLLSRIQKITLDAFSNQDVPIEKLVQDLNIQRSAGQMPLFQTMFAYQNLPGTVSQSNGIPDGVSLSSGSFELTSALQAKPYRVDNGTAKFDLTLYVYESDQGMNLNWQFNSDLFDLSSIEQLSSQFQTLLEGFTDKPTCLIDELPLLPKSDRYKIEHQWNSTQTRRVNDRSFVKLFELQVEQSPDATATVGIGERLTYRQLNERANQFGRYFQKLGVAAETLVGVCMERSPNFLACLLGVWKAGGAYLPLDPEYPVERIAMIVNESKAKLLIAESRFLKTLPANIDCKTISLESEIESITRESVNNLNINIAAENLAYVIYTSGSSGTPKGAMITHGNVCHCAQSISEAVVITSNDVYLHTASFSFSSSVRQYVVPLSRGAMVILASSDDKRDPQKLFELIKNEKVTVIDLVPTHLAKCIHLLKSLEPSLRAGLLANHLRLVLSASEPLQTNLTVDLENVFGRSIPMINMFGQTETTGIVLTYPVPQSIHCTTAITPIGRPIANTRAYILDAARQLLPVGVIGELYIGGVNLGRGYLNQPELTSKHFIANPFSTIPASKLYRTGDLARYRADGVIEFHGRSDQQIKVSGFRIEPGEIESAIRRITDIHDCYVGMFDNNQQDSSGPESRLVAFVTVNSNNLSTETIRLHLRKLLPQYMMPQAIVILESIPRLPNGKVDRFAIHARIKSSPATIVAPLQKRTVRTPPRTEVEMILANIWKSSLQLDAVGVDENFFDLGGNSLISIDIIVRTKQAGLNLTLAQLYQKQTIAELAELAVQKSNTPREIKLNDPAILARPKTHLDKVPLVTIESLREYGRESFLKVGLDPRGAEIVTEVQLEASMRGQPTHNMVSIPRYAKRLSTGKLNPRPNIRIEKETNNSALIDGDNGPGQWVSTVAMDLAVRKAQESGVGMVSVRRSNHFGAAGHYVWQATKAGMIGICTTNGPLILAPTGGVTPTFGNNPIGVGIPASKYRPILLDIAMSVAPRGKIGLNVAEGKPLETGWILDRFGRPSTDLADLAAGLGVPIGGHKGYGLALILEVLAGALGGAGVCLDHRRDKLQIPGHNPDYGHFFMVIDPTRFSTLDVFTARVDRMIEQTKGGNLSEGASEILIPGEMELRARELSLSEGVRLRPSIYHSLLSYAQDAGLTTELKVTDWIEMATEPEAAARIVESSENEPQIIPFDRSELEQNIITRFEMIVSIKPHSLALTGNGQRWTYDQLDRRSNQIAHAILNHTKQGVGCVAYLVDHSPNMVMCALGILKAAKAYLCIHPGLPPTAQEKIFQNSAPDLIITRLSNAEILRKYPDIRCEIITLEDIGDQYQSLKPDLMIHPDNPAAIFYTSGSTGEPKGVIKNHQTILHRAWLSAKYDNINTVDRLSLLTYCSFASSEADVFGALLNGASVHTFEVGSLGLNHLGKWIDEHKITHLHPPVILFRRYLSTLTGSKYHPSVKLIALAGESVVESDITGWKDRFESKCQLRFRFSSTETGHLAVASIEAGSAGTEHFKPVVQAVDDKQLIITDEKGNPCPADKEGELVVRSRFLSDGYWRNPEETLRSFAKVVGEAGIREYHTGDIGRLRVDGSFEFLGRRDNQVKIRGYRIEIGEIENTLRSLDGVKESAVIADRSTHEPQLIGFVVMQSGAVFVKETIYTSLRKLLPPWKVPIEILPAEIIPLTLTGKIDRQSLAEIAKSKPSTVTIEDDSAGSKIDLITARLITMVESILGRTGLRPGDNFFDHGGHSLLAAQLMHEIQLHFGRSLAPMILFEYPTIKQLAEVLSNDAESVLPEYIECLKQGSIHPPLYCIPVVGGSGITYYPLARLLKTHRAVYGMKFPDKGINGITEPTVEQIATYFLGQIKKQNPSGPYFLCGHSYGAVIAFEMAQQLDAIGQRVELLAMLDGRVPGSQKRLPFSQRIPQHLRRLRTNGFRPIIINSLKRLTKKLEYNGPYSSKPISNHLPSIDSDGMIQTHKSGEPDWKKIFRNYQPKPYIGTITLFKAMEQPEWYHLLIPKPYYGWDEFCKNIQIFDAAGDHLSIIKEPNLPTLAQTIDKLLGELRNQAL